MKVLITGADGFIGKNLALHLSERKDVQVVCFARTNAEADLPTLLQDVDFVFHLAGVNRPQNPQDFVSGNTGLTLALCHALGSLAQATGKRIPIVFTSSAQASLANPYGLSKIAQELVGTASGGHPRTFIARPFNHVGPRQDQSFVSAAFARQIAEIEAGLKPPVIEVGNLSARRDLTDVRDTVYAYRLIVERGLPGRPYNVCRGEAIAVQALLDTLVSLSTVSVDVVPDPARYRPNDSPIVLGNPARAMAELGWTPRIPLEQTLHDLLDYWRARVQCT